MKKNITSLFSTSLNLLIVDDDIGHLSEMAQWLSQRKGEIFKARSCQQALKILGKQRVDAVITDWQMPEMSGLNLIESLRGSGFAGPVLICTGMMLSPEHLQKAFETGASDYLRKPLNHVELNTRLDNAWLMYAQKKALQLTNGSQQRFIDLLTRNLGNDLHDLIQMQRLRPEPEAEKQLSKGMFDDFQKLTRWARYRFDMNAVHMYDFELKSVLKGLLSAFSEQAHRLRIRGGKGLYVHSDPEIVLRVLSELVDNSLRYTRGQVGVSVKKTENSLQFMVKDTAESLSEGDLERLLGSTSQNLGLTICQDLLALLDSELKTRHSRAGENVFYFTLKHF